MDYERTEHDAKVGRGIGLRPSLWRRIDAFAKQQRRNRNQVIEAILELHVPYVDDSQNLRANSQNSTMRAVPDDEMSFVEEGPVREAV